MPVNKLLGHFAVKLCVNIYLLLFKSFADFGVLGLHLLVEVTLLQPAVCRLDEVKGLV